MKNFRFEKLFFTFNSIFWSICLLPSMLMAHPGHYHPDETDEFDFLKSTIFHTHGALELSLACVAIAAAFVVWLNKTPLVRLSALGLVIGAAVGIAVQ